MAHVIDPSYMFVADLLMNAIPGCNRDVAGIIFGYYTRCEQVGDCYGPHHYEDTRHGVFCAISGQCKICRSDSRYNLHERICPYWLPVLCSSYNFCKGFGRHYGGCPSMPFKFEAVKVAKK